MKFVNSLFGYLLVGLAFWLPIGIIIIAVIFVFGSIEDLGKKILVIVLHSKFIYPGFGVLLGLFIFYLTGLVLKKTSIGDSLSGIPFFGLFFRKEGGEIITLERLRRLIPCLFLLSPTCPSYGWIVSEERIKINGQEAEFCLINVYYPNVPLLITGQVFPVRKESVMKLGNPSKEIIDLLLYVLRSPRDIQYLPWKDESKEGFQKRAALFGLKSGTD